MADDELVSSRRGEDQDISQLASPPTQNTTIASTNNAHDATTFMLNFKFVNFIAYCFTTRDITASVEV